MGKSSVYEKWRSSNHKHLEICRDKRLLVTFSGGKDSTVCLEFLHRSQEPYGFDIEAHIYPYPVHRYSTAFKETIQEYWGERGVKLVYHETRQDDTCLESSGDPCRLCQEIRKKILFSLFSQLEAPLSSLVIVSGHSLWDLAGYALEVFIERELSGEGKHVRTEGADRFREIAQRFYPYLVLPEGYSVFRPMLCLNQDEIEAVVKAGDIPVLGVPCRYSPLRPKKILGVYFARFGHKFSYERVMNFAKKYLSVADIHEFKPAAKEEYLSRHF
ncbi:MAG TPA: hypothetical protein EYP57_07590 [Thermodesulfobacteriaceae bacterium]|nr:hypothetical protein [Thermodesulfobacteriaceae bacterium]